MDAGPPKYKQECYLLDYDGWQYNREIKNLTYIHNKNTTGNYKYLDFS
jgi:hypothetical protein